MTIKRGQVYYIRKAYTTGSEQWAGRPGIIVSNDHSNLHSRTVEVVYMTTQPKANTPTHVTIRSLDRESTALCEQISSVAIERLGDRLGQISDQEMADLEAAMAASLGIQQTDQPEWTDAEAELERLEAAYDRLRHELTAEKAKTAALQWAYETLMDRMLGKEGPKC